MKARDLFDFYMLFALIFMGCQQADDWLKIKATPLLVEQDHQPSHQSKFSSQRLPSISKALIFEFMPKTCFKEYPALEALLMTNSITSQAQGKNEGPKPYQALFQLDDQKRLDNYYVDELRELQKAKHLFVLKLKLKDLSDRFIKEHQEQLLQALAEVQGNVPLEKQSDQTETLRLMWEKQVFDQMDQLKKNWLKKIPTLYILSAWQSDLWTAQDKDNLNQKVQLTQLLFDWSLNVKEGYLPITHQVQWLLPNLKREANVKQEQMQRFLSLLKDPKAQSISLDSNHCDWVPAFLDQAQAFDPQLSLLPAQRRYIDHFSGLKIVAIDQDIKDLPETQVKLITECRRKYGLNHQVQSFNWAMVLFDREEAVQLFPFYHQGLPHIWDQDGGEAFMLWKNQEGVIADQACHLSLQRSQLLAYHIDQFDWFTASPQSISNTAIQPLKWRAKLLGEDHKLKDQSFLLPDLFELLELESSSSLSWDFKGILNEIFGENGQGFVWSVFQGSSFELPIYSSKGELKAMGWINFFQYAPYLFLFQESLDQAFELLGENLLQLRSPYLLLLSPQAPYPDFLWKYQSAHPLLMPLNQPLFFKKQQKKYWDYAQRWESAKAIVSLGKQPWKLLSLFPKYFWQAIPTEKIPPLLFHSPDQRLVIKDKLSKIYQLNLFKSLITLNPLEKISIDMGIFGNISFQIVNRHQSAQNQDY